MRFSGLIFFSLLCSLSTCLAASGRGVRWLDSTYDFGAVDETGGPVRGTVRMVNDSDLEVIIERVRTSCGCTTAYFPENPIAPGDTATVSFEFQPAGRPGRIDKYLRVYLAGYDEPYRIRLDGTVIPSEETLRYSFPAVCGALRLSASALDAGRIEAGRVRHTFVYLYNPSLSPVTPEVISSDSRIRVSISPPTISPGETATMAIQLLPALTASEGVFDTEIGLSDGSPGDDIPCRITVRAESVSRKTDEDSSRL